MSDQLPEGWSEATLDELAEIVGGVTKGQRRRPDQKLRAVPYLRVANVQRGHLDLAEMKEIEATEAEIAELRLQPGDILFTEGGDRDKLGRGWIWSGEIRECIHQNHIFRARLRVPAFEGKLISWFGNVFGQKYFMGEASQTVNLASINITKLRRLAVRLPPIGEQPRIVKQVEALLADVNKAKGRLDRVPLILKRFRQAVLAAACSGELTREWREGHAGGPSAASLVAGLFGERRQAHERATADARKAGARKPTNPKNLEPATVPGDLPEVPPSWAWVVLDDVCDDITVGHVGPMAKEYVDNGIPFLRSQNVRPFRFSGDGLKYITRTFHQRLSKSALRPGDLVVVRSGNAGEACVVPPELPEANCADLVVMRPSRALDPHFGAIFINSSSARAHIDDVKVGIAQGHYNIGSARETPIPLPPLDEQRAIVVAVHRLFSLSDAIERRVQAATARADKLPQAILSKAFSGELVPTEAELARAEGRTFETAAEMLARIANGNGVERANATDATDKKTSPRSGTGGQAKVGGRRVKSARGDDDQSA